MARSKVPRHELVRLFAGRLNQASASREIAAYLVSTGRTAELDSLLRDLVQYQAGQGIVEVTAISAHPLEAKARDDVERQVRTLYPEAATVIVNNMIDTSVLAGVALELPGQQLDLSARAKLNKLKQLTGKDR